MIDVGGRLVAGDTCVGIVELKEWASRDFITYI